MSLDPHTVEGIARVVGVDADGAWLEPEQTTSCGHCASADACAGKGIGSLAGRLETRRFRIPRSPRLAVGERVVVGIDERALIKGALVAYAVPLAATLAVGGLAQAIADSDVVTLAAMAAGLAVGLLAARLGARRLTARGELAPRLLRRAGPSETCGSGA